MNKYYLVNKFQRMTREKLLLGINGDGTLIHLLLNHRAV